MDLGVTILSYPHDIAQVMSICRWPLSQTILDSYRFFELLAAYDDHHMSDDDDKGTTSVKKKKNLFKNKAKGFGCLNICIKK
jgi:hypothetical protein